MRRLAAQLGLLLFLAQAASAGYIAGRIVDIRGADRGEIVRVDWQYPWQLPACLLLAILRASVRIWLTKTAICLETTRLNRV